MPIDAKEFEEGINSLRVSYIECVTNYLIKIHPKAASFQDIKWDSGISATEDSIIYSILDELMADDMINYKNVQEPNGASVLYYQYKKEEKS